MFLSRSHCLLAFSLGLSRSARVFFVCARSRQKGRRAKKGKKKAPTAAADAAAALHFLSFPDDASSAGDLALARCSSSFLSRAAPLRAAAASKRASRDASALDRLTRAVEHYSSFFDIQQRIHLSPHKRLSPTSLVRQLRRFISGSLYEFSRGKTNKPRKLADESTSAFGRRKCRRRRRRKRRRRRAALRPRQQPPWKQPLLLLPLSPTSR